MTELPKAFDPKEAQAKWLAHWEAKGYFASDPDPAKKPYTIVIPPPNVTGALHMGHALNNTLQDVLIRWKRMQGFNALWMPGTDHAGIATQAVVERLLKAEDKTFDRREYGREKLVAKIWEWKDKYEARIIEQLKALGASCDWRRTRFTLDDQCARAVRETFFRMFKDGYIYRGKRLVNWDTQLQTSVADDETYTEDTKGGFWTFQYEILDEPRTTESGEKQFIQFSTTRPETMLGDTALCVHPHDERYKHLIGKYVLQPLVNRKIPIIADGQLADPELGTGCVKVTPAHDPNDYACWQRNPQIGIMIMMHPDGTIFHESSEDMDCGKYEGMDRFEARKLIVEDMKALGLYVDYQERMIPLKYSDRSKTPIEPYLSDQWFVKMSDRDDGKPGLAQMAMDAVTSGKVEFFPERYKNSYLDWLGEKRDWCISRQLWWGHRIPVWRIETNRFTDLAKKPITGGVDNSIQLARFDQAKRGLLDFLALLGIEKHEYCLIDDFEDECCAWLCISNERNADLLNTVESYVNGLSANALPPHMRTPEEDTANKEKRIRQYPSIEPYARYLEDITLFEREEDVLDTWFSSALWPHSTLGWPEETPELKYYYPTSTLVTSRDIITLWVARMVLTGLYNLDAIPFHHVYITPKLLDGFGETMSKSKGNGVDPLDIIDLYGTDALRYAIVNLATETQDSRLPVVNVCPHCQAQVAVKQEHMYMRTKKLACPQCKQSFRPGGPWPIDDTDLPTAKQGSDKFELGRNFANKLWNATRFILMNLEGYTPRPVDMKGLAVEDRWIVSRLATTARKITAALEGYHFAEAAKQIYEFTWSEFCDWYIEMSKSRRSDPVCQRVLLGVLDGILRLIHPIMPFVSESLWHALAEAAPVRGLPSPSQAEESAIIAKWPAFDATLIDENTETSIARMQELIRGIREVRNRYSIDKEPLAVAVKCSDAVAKEFAALRPFIESLGGLKSFECGPAATKPKQAASLVNPEFETYVALAGLIDPAAEAKRLEKQIEEKKKTLAATTAKLGNESFVSRAPAEVVQQQKDLVKDLEQQIQALTANLAELRS